MKLPNFPMMGDDEAGLIDRIIEFYDCKDCLEWGSGTSTLYFPKRHAINLWLSIEDDKEYYESLMEKEIPKNVKLVLADIPEYFTKSKGKYDFILVDGIEGQRIACMQYAIDHSLLKVDGVLLLHDSQREMYKKAFKLFPFYKNLTKTIGIGDNGSIGFNGLTIFSDKKILI